jgi:hypothetical protein
MPTDELHHNAHTLTGVGFNNVTSHGKIKLILWDNF